MELGQKIVLAGLVSFFVGYFIGNRKRKDPITGKVSNAWGGRPDPGLFQDIVDETTSIFTGEPMPSDAANDLVNYAIQNDWSPSQQTSIQNLAASLSDFDLDSLYQYYLIWKTNNDLANIPSDVYSSAIATIQANNLPQ